jgi:hypothetical protein
MMRAVLATFLFMGAAVSAVTLAGCGATPPPLEAETDAGFGAGGYGGYGGAGAGGYGGTTTPGNVGGSGGTGPVYVDAGSPDNGGRRRRDAGTGTTEPRDAGAGTGDRDGGRIRTRSDASTIPACPAGAAPGAMCTSQQSGDICALTGDAGSTTNLCTCRARGGGPGTWRCFRR